MAVEVFTSFGQQCDANGVPISGALIYVYDVNSTTPKTVYSDKDLGVSAANPIECDAYGRHDMRYIATGSYKVVTKTSAGTTVYTRDNIDGRVPVGSGALAIANGGTGATSAGAALSALGAATAAELADVTAEVASISGSLASTEKTHIATGTTAQRTASPVDGDIRRNTTVPQFEGHNGSTWEQFITSQNFAATLLAGLASGSPVKFAKSETGAVSTTTTTIPFDDTIPQNTEGGEFMTLAFTPTNASNTLKIETVFICSVSSAGNFTVALFQDSTANALAAAVSCAGVSGAAVTVTFTHYMTAGTTSATTLKVRAGPSSANTITFNGGSSARLMGGVMASSITITEIKA